MTNNTDISNVNVEEETNLTNEQLNEQNEENDKKKKKKKKKKSKIIFNTLVTILFIVILLNAVIGMINMQRINNDEEPIWYLGMETTETELKTVTEYHLGLYKIVKTDTARETKTTLKSFFLK